eukprot:1146558-Pelagomonas_calceolata.AAC.1
MPGYVQFQAQPLPGTHHAHRQHQPEHSHTYTNEGVLYATHCCQEEDGSCWFNVQPNQTATTARPTSRSGTPHSHTPNEIPTTCPVSHDDIPPQQRAPQPAALAGASLDVLGHA